MQIPELMTGGNRGDEQLSRIPSRRIAAEHWVGRAGYGCFLEDEVYNYGSFKQSKMFAAGVTCSDCHEPHAAKLRAPGDGVCMQCHAADKYAAVTHHQHEAVNRPLSCASCHMPERTYMVVDRRHDHSFRVPRPDLSVKLGTPNACNECHADKSAQWAASAIEAWHGADRNGWQKYAEAFHSAWNDQADAAALLAAVAADANTPAFACASALTELAPRLSPANINLARSALADPDPMVRTLDKISFAQLSKKSRTSSPRPARGPKNGLVIFCFEGEPSKTATTLRARTEPLQAFGSGQLAS